MEHETIAQDKWGPAADATDGIDGLSGRKFVDIVVEVHRRLIDEVSPTDRISRTPDEWLSRAEAVVAQYAQEHNLAIPAALRQRIAVEAVAEMTGYGPIQPLIDDPTVTEILVNGPYSIYVEREGKLLRTKRQFADNTHVLKVIERIVGPLGRRIDESSPMVDARLPDGSRVNAIIPPLAIDGPTLSVRKFSRVPYTPEALCEKTTVNYAMLEFFKAAVEGKLSIMISGGAGTGKTTTLNALSSYIPSSERVVTIEDAAELQLQQEHVVRLECRPPNLEGKGEINVRHLVRNSLRMRPDRIIVGEVRGAEALDMLQAMNTGHEGSLCTLHANSARDALARLETMVLMAGTDLPSRSIREQIASAIDIMVHQSRFRDGSRKVTQVFEVIGMEGEVITTQEIFKFAEHGVDEDGRIIGEHVATGIKPGFVERLERHGIELPEDMFTPPNNPGKSKWASLR